MRTFFFLLISFTLLLPFQQMRAQKTGLAVKAPDEIKTPSHVGEIIFPHKAHSREYDVKCSDCHHRLKAPPLDIPHRYYSRDNWKDCTYCHGPGNRKKNIYSCKSCHSMLGNNYMKQILSYKTVIHKTCERCHQLGKGTEASKSCKFCHSGPKREYK